MTRRSKSNHEKQQKSETSTLGAFYFRKKKKKNDEDFPELDIIMFAGAVPGGGPGGLVPPLKFNI